ncbi:unnamed protein product, partial [Allacma fusca]
KMVRNYIRQTTRGQTYTTDDIVNAVCFVKSGHSAHEAEKIFLVPSKTIRRRLDPKWGDPSIRKHGGFQQLFSKAQEEELASYLKIACDRFLGLSMRDLSFRTPQPTSIYRAKGFSKENVDVFHQNFLKVQSSHHFPPGRIFNVDETGFSVVMRTVKVVGEKGTRQVGRLVSAERGRLVTAICCGNAVGEFIPPMLIFPSISPSKKLHEKIPQDWVLAGTGNGWSNDQIFMIWIEHFTAFSKPNDTNPVLLLLDNHTSHISIEILNFCEIHNIHMLSIPPHTSHKLQPLDVSVYSAIKSRLSKLEQEWMSQNAPKRLTEENLPEIFKIAYDVSATPSNMISGFRKCGIVPFDPTVFSDKDYAPSNTFSNTVFNVNESNSRNDMDIVESPLNSEGEEDVHQNQIEHVGPRFQEDNVEQEQFVLQQLNWETDDENRCFEDADNNEEHVFYIDLTNQHDLEMGTDNDLTQVEINDPHNINNDKSLEAALREVGKSHGFADEIAIVPLLKKMLHSLKENHIQGASTIPNDVRDSSFKQSPFKMRPLPTLKAVQSGRPRGRRPGKSEILTGVEFKERIFQEGKNKKHVKSRSYNFRSRRSNEK